MAAFRRTKSGRRADVDVEEKREYRLAPKNAVENFVFVACTNVKEEPEGAVDKDVATLKESSVPECEVRTKKDTDKVGAFEEISVPECDVHVKEEADETDAIAAAAVPERDPLQIEEEELVATTRSSPDSERSVQNIKVECCISPPVAVEQAAAFDQLGFLSVTSSWDHLPGGHNQKQTFGDQDSRLGGSELDGFTCNTCQQTFPSKYALLMHVFVHIDGVEPPVNVCRLCCEVFPTPQCLHTHMKTKEKECAAEKTGHRFLDTNKKRENDRKLRSTRWSRCTMECGRENTSETSESGSFCKTENISHTESCDGCSDNSQKSIPKDVTVMTGKQTQIGKETNTCHICNVSFMSLAHLKQHSVVHSVHRPFSYRCNDCGKSFKYKLHLEMHTVSHTNTPGACGLVCSECGKCFKVEARLRRHLETHSGEKPYLCRECGKSFCTLGYLKKHSSVHTGEKPYTCAVCFKSFAVRSRLKVHSIVHIGGRPHKCDICNKYFLNSRDLQQHVKVHIL